METVNINFSKETNNLLFVSSFALHSYRGYALKTLMVTKNTKDLSVTKNNKKKQKKILVTKQTKNI